MRHKHDLVAQEMARLVNERLIKVSHVQDDHTARLVRLEAGITDLSDKVSGHDTRFDALESRFDGLESQMGALDSRMGAFEGRLDGLETRMGGVETALTEVLRRLPDPSTNDGGSGG